MSSTTLATVAPRSASGSAATPTRIPSAKSSLSKSTPVANANPSPGTFRHPYLAEVVKRQSKTAVSTANIHAAAINVAAVLFITVFFNMLHQGLSMAVGLTPLGHDWAGAMASYGLYSLIILFIANTLLSLRSLLPYSKPVSYDDIPLTPSQRQLLGLPPSTAPTPESSSRESANASPYITPPRYSRRLSSSSTGHSPSSQLTGASGASSERFSTLGNYSQSPLSTSRYTLGFSSPAAAAHGSSTSSRRTASGSPFSPTFNSSNITGSPLFQKAVQQHRHDRSNEAGFDISSRSSFGMARSSSLGTSSSLREMSPSSRRRNANANTDVTDREQRSPIQKGVNYKWMYDKGF